MEKDVPVMKDVATEFERSDYYERLHECSWATHRSAARIQVEIVLPLLK